ncbi:MAG: hypothetical protein IBX61_10030 [Thermoleophilia bacterium]|nr:hypothetical protein [Thermoleophilia bacterium]
MKPDEAANQKSEKNFDTTITNVTIRHRSRQAKGCVTRQTMLTTAFKLGMCAEDNWRRLRGFKHLAVITGVKSKDGIEIEESNRSVA